MLEQQKMHGLWTRLQNRENDQNFVNNGNKLQKSSIYYRKTAKKRSRFDVASGMPARCFSSHFERGKMMGAKSALTTVSCKNCNEGLFANPTP